MSLLQSLASEMSLPVLINIHNVTQARMYTDRIVGMRHGQMIFDGEPKDFNQDALDAIYGGIESPEEDGEDSKKQASQDQEAST
jgi:phosphonate transport system ATP-binding protein